MIAVQLASLPDLSHMVAFGASAFAASNYSELGYNAVIARRTLKNAMSDNSMRVFVAKRNGQVCGVLIGSIDPMPFCGGLSATDLVFIAYAGGDLLLDAFLDWCKVRRVTRIDCGVSQADDKRVERLFRRKGFTRAGGLFYKQRKVA